MFTFEPGVFVWTLVSFAILLAVISRYVYPPVRDSMRARSQTIARNLSETERKLAEAEARAKELEEKLLATRLEEARILGEAREKARIQHDEQLRKTLEEMRDLRRARENDLAKLEEGFYESTQRDFTRLVISTCEKVLKAGLPEELQRRIIEDRITELEALEL